MKPLFRRIGLAILPVFLIACEDLFSSREPGNLVIHFSTRPSSKAADLPDSSAFLLRVLDEDGKTIYDGLFGDCPDPLQVDPGTYRVSVRSCTFSKPAFDMPLYGDDQDAVVSSGATVDVALTCRQLNAGIRLKIGPDFLTACPKGLFFVQSEEGRLQYAYREQRIAYFQPGNVSVMLDNEGQQDILYTRELEAREILTVAVSVPGSAASSSSRISVQVDTSRNWTGDAFVIGEGGGNRATGADKDHAMDVATARGKTGATGVWVYGYIVGCASPFLGSSSETNLAIAGKTTATSKASCMSVELKKGALRDALNMVKNPGNKGRKVFLKGDLATYYGMPGVKNVTEYVLDQ